jgi:hypothetical protein
MSWSRSRFGQPAARRSRVSFAHAYGSTSLRVCRWSIGWQLSPTRGHHHRILQECIFSRNGLGPNCHSSPLSRWFTGRHHFHSFDAERQIMHDANAAANRATRRPLTKDAEQETIIINRSGRQIHLSRRAICPNKRSHLWTTASTRVVVTQVTFCLHLLSRHRQSHTLGCSLQG